MLLPLILVALLLRSEASPVTEDPFKSTTEASLCPCPDNSTAKPTFEDKVSNMLIHGMTCVCHTDPVCGVHKMRDDYVYSPGIGMHKLHTRAATWNEARKKCIEEGGHLAIINSKYEANILRDIFTSAGPIIGASYVDLAYVGIHDLFQEKDWVTVLGDSLHKTGYTAWSDKWGGQPDNGGQNQNCGGFLKEGGLDDVNCGVPFAFFCELPITSYNLH